MPHRKIATASLETFARTGRMGKVCVGTARSVVRARWGLPTDSAAGRPNRREGVRKYGDVQLHFHDGRVSLIHCDDFVGVPVGGPFSTRG